jgi:hypothetical protein
LKQRQQEEKEELNQLISKKENLQEQIDELFKRRDIMQIDFRAQKETLDKQIADAQNQRNEKLESIRLAESGFSELEEIGYEKYIPTMLSDDIERKIFKVELDIGELMAKDNVIIIERHYTIDKSTSKGEKFQKVFGKNLLTGFNTYVQVKTKSVTENNYNRTCELIKNSFEKFNKQGKMVGIYFNSKYLDLCIEKLKYILELKIKKAKEKTELHEERKRMREQEKLLEEARKEKEKLEAQKKELNKLFSKQLTEQERKTVNNKIAKIDKRIRDIDWRIEHTSAGWLYIATTPCLQNMVKIGCTRQLNPLLRLAQLSSASVPYPFECKGLVFSETVFDLEAKVHQYFDTQRVNKENSHKEFFYINEQEVINVLKNHFNQEVHFINENWLEESLDT